MNAEQVLGLLVMAALRKDAHGEMALDCPHCQRLNEALRRWMQAHRGGER